MFFFHNYHRNETPGKFIIGTLLILQKAVSFNYFEPFENAETFWAKGRLIISWKTK